MTLAISHVKRFEYVPPSIFSPAHFIDGTIRPDLPKMVKIDENEAQAVCLNTWTFELSSVVNVACWEGLSRIDCWLMCSV